MFFKKKFLFLTIFLIIIFQVLIYLNNNNQKTSIKFFEWTSKEVSIGKLISISFFSGLIISTLLGTTTTNHKKSNFENKEENFESFNNEEEYEPNIEIPPQRDVRDAQPTISVNYRVVKNKENNNFKSDQNSSNNSDDKDDWINDNNEW